jgi:hypothetical protein
MCLRTTISYTLFDWYSCLVVLQPFMWWVMGDHGVYQEEASCQPQRNEDCNNKTYNSILFLRC